MRFALAHSWKAVRGAFSVFQPEQTSGKKDGIKTKAAIKWQNCTGLAPPVGIEEHKEQLFALSNNKIFNQ